MLKLWVYLEQQQIKNISCELNLKYMRCLSKRDCFIRRVLVLALLNISLISLLGNLLSLSLRKQVAEVCSCI